MWCGLEHSNSHKLEYSIVHVYINYTIVYMYSIIVPIYNIVHVHIEYNIVYMYILQ